VPGRRQSALSDLCQRSNLPVGLGVVGRGFYVGQAGQARELLEVPSDELGAVVGYDPAPGRAWSAGFPITPTIRN
jgi:hypothetical protein